MQRHATTTPTVPPPTDRRDDAISRLLRRGGIIDLTTTGRRTGEPRRIEIVFHDIDGRMIITGDLIRAGRGRGSTTCKRIRE
jgi:hypothetical protein